MATFEETVFLFQFLIFLGLFLLRLYNLMNNQEIYNISISFLMYIGGIILIGTGYFSAILNYSSNLTMQMFKLQIPLFLLNTIFLFIELVLFSQKTTASTRRQAYNAKEHDLKK